MKTINHKPLYFLLTLCSGLLLAAGLSIGASRAGGALLYIDPETTTAGPGESSIMTVQLENASNVYGVDLLMSFDPSILQVIDADPVLTGTQILAGTCPQPDFVILNQADNISGTLEYAVSQLLPTPPCNGGEVAQIEFQCVGVGTSGVNISTDTIISNSDAVSITYTAQNASIVCTTMTSTPGPTPTATEKPPSATPTAFPTLAENNYLPVIINSTEIAPTPTQFLP